MAVNLAHPSNRRQVLTIDDLPLPDDVFLEIFDFYVVRYQYLARIHDTHRNFNAKLEIESWQSLAHVCRRWRGLVFGSSGHLNLQLYYIITSPELESREWSERTSLDVWPALPLFIQGDVFETTMDNVIATFKHSDRICQIDLDYNTASKIENLWSAMQVPFPELALLYLGPGPYLEDGSLSNVTVLPDSFLGGSAPRLQYLHLHAIPFPGLPKLLCSATHLVHLSLLDIPHSGYISPEAMATCLSMLTSLEELSFRFHSSQSSPDQENRRPPPPTRSVLPALTKFSFRGTNDYLEELVAQIDAPRLYRLEIKFFYSIGIDTPELIQFTNRTPAPGAYNVAVLSFCLRRAIVRFQSHIGPLLYPPDGGKVEVMLLFPSPNRQHVSCLAQICQRASSCQLLTMENLYIEGLSFAIPFVRNDDIENTEWLDLLLQFTAVKNLYLSYSFSPRIVPALQDLARGSSTEVFPTLQNIFLEWFRPSEPVHEGIAQFISARQLINRPVAISEWKRVV